MKPEYDSILGMMKRRYEVMFPEEYRGLVVRAVNVFEAIDIVQAKMRTPSAVHLQHLPD